MLLLLVILRQRNWREIMASLSHIDFLMVNKGEVLQPLNLTVHLSVLLQSTETRPHTLVTYLRFSVITLRSIVKVLHLSISYTLIQVEQVRGDPNPASSHL